MHNEAIFGDPFAAIVSPSMLDAVCADIDDKAMNLRLVAVLLAAAASSTIGSATATDAACGAPGKPTCPLQAFMRMHVAAPLVKADYGELEKSFETIAKLNPEPVKWANWTKIANDARAAARDKRKAALRASCGRCHRAYRRAYNSHFRERSIAR